MWYQICQGSVVTMCCQTCYRDLMWVPTAVGRRPGNVSTEHVKSVFPKTCAHQVLSNLSHPQVKTCAVDPMCAYIHTYIYIYMYYIVLYYTISYYNILYNILKTMSIIYKYTNIISGNFRPRFGEWLKHAQHIACQTLLPKSFTIL